MSGPYQLDSGRAAKGVSVISVRREGCVTSFICEPWWVCLLTKAPARLRTMREQSHRENATDGPLSPANLEVLDPCHPRTWNLKTADDFSVARSGARVAFPWLVVLLMLSWVRW